MKKRSFAIIFVILLFISACQVKAPAVPVPPSVFTAESSVTPAPPVTIKLKRAAPSQLEAIEGTAVDIMDDINSQDWMAAADKVTLISNNLTVLWALPELGSVPGPAVDALASAANGLRDVVASQETYDALVEANMITGAIPDIADYFETAVPTDVLRLGFHGRELILETRHQDWASAEADVTIIDGIWLRLKPELSIFPKTDRERFQGTLDRLKANIAGKDAAGAASDTKTFLENVETLRKDFAEQYREQ